MSDLTELYQELILENSKHPQNFGAIDNPTCSASGHNPLCGDKVTVYLTLDGDTVTDIRFEGSGCAISVASASLMTECLKGKTRQELQTLFSAFHGMVTGEDIEVEGNVDLETLSILAGVKNFPIRVKCATLAWHAVQSALENKETPVSTE